MTTDIHDQETRGTVPSKVVLSDRVSRTILAIRTGNQTSQGEINAAGSMPESIAESRDIVERLVNQEAAALEELFDRMSGRAFGLAYRILGDGPAAEDVVQDVFVWIWDNTAKLDPRRGSVDGLILTMTHRRSVDSLRSRTRRAAISNSQMSAQHMDDVIELVDHVQSVMNAEAIREAIDMLPSEQFEVVDLAYFGGMTHSEISAHTGFPLGTVKSRLRLAMNSLKRAFGLTGSGGAS